MTRPVNLFYRIVRDENSTTELLCNLLAFKSFRDCFLRKILPPESLDLLGAFDYGHINTQFDFGENGIPDLVIDDEENAIIVIEVKIRDASLTDNQPKGYLKHLNSEKCPHKNKWIVLLAPESYARRSDWEDSVRDYGAIKNKMITWEEIISMVEEYDLGELNHGFKDFFNLLKSWYLCDVHFNTQEILIMFKEESARAFSKLLKTIDRVGDSFGIKRKDSLCEDEGEYGIYFKKDGKNVFWFGWWLPFWVERGKPLCFGVIDSESTAHLQERFKNLHEGNCEMYNSLLLTWIEEKTFSQDNCAEEIIKIISKDLGELGLCAEGQM